MSSSLKGRPAWVDAASVGSDDMVLLTKPDVSGVVSNLESRLRASMMYTYIGHVLVCCNPYHWLPIYGEETVQFYAHKQRNDAPPHIYGVAEAAFRAMVLEEEKQCVIISGE